MIDREWYHIICANLGQPAYTNVWPDKDGAMLLEADGEPYRSRQWWWQVEGEDMLWRYQLRMDISPASGEQVRWVRFVASDLWKPDTGMTVLLDREPTHPFVLALIAESWGMVL